MQHSLLLDATSHRYRQHDLWAQLPPKHTHRHTTYMKIYNRYRLFHRHQGIERMRQRLISKFCWKIYECEYFVNVPHEMRPCDFKQMLDINICWLYTCKKAALSVSFSASIQNCIKPVVCCNLPVQLICCSCLSYVYVCLKWKPINTMWYPRLMLKMCGYIFHYGCCHRT